MLGKTGIIFGLAAGITLGGPLAANAQMRTTTVRVPVVSAMPAGPTRAYGVPRAQVLGMGTNLVSADLYMGGIGLVPAPVGVGVGNVSGNGLNLRAEMGMGNGLELGTGIGAAATAPWRGRLDLSGKWGLLQEGPAIVSLAGLAGGVLEVDANGVPSLGLQVGVPVSKIFPFGTGQSFGLSVVPTWNLGILNVPRSLVGAAMGPFNFFGLGLAGDLGLMPTLHLLADTQLGFPVAGLNTQSAVGLRYAFSPTWTGDLFVGLNSGASLGVNGGPASLGLGSTWAF